MNKNTFAPSLIDAKSLLRKIHRKMTRKRTWRKFRLDRIVLSRFATQAADDCGLKKNLVAYMYYPSAKIIKVSGDYWLVARGVVGGNKMLASDYIGDIIAIKTTKPHRGTPAKDLAEQAFQLIGQNQNLTASLLTFLADGTVLYNPNNPLAMEVNRELSKLLFSISVRQASVRLKKNDTFAEGRLLGQDLMYRRESVGIIVGILLDVLGK